MIDVPRLDPGLLQKSYMGILEFGLMSLRNYSQSEYQRYIEVEIDHLHNIPSYYIETNVHRHGYYFCSEKNVYLEELDKLENIETEFLLARYRMFWDEMRTVLAPYKHLLSEQRIDQWED